MRAYVISSENMGISAAFTNIEEAVKAMKDTIIEENDFGNYGYFDRYKDTCISMSIDVLEMTEDEFNSYNEAME